MNFYDNELEVEEEEEEEEEEALVTIHRFISTFTMGQSMDDGMMCLSLSNCKRHIRYFLKLEKIPI